MTTLLFEGAYPKALSYLMIKMMADLRSEIKNESVIDVQSIDLNDDQNAGRSEEKTTMKFW